MRTAIGSKFTLEEVAEHFKQWRSIKKKGERIPEQLWREAANLVGAYGVSEITRTLRLSGTDLNKRRGIGKTGRRRRQPDGGMTFVEVDSAVMGKVLEPEAAAVWMELERPDGLRLRIQSTRGADMLTLAERFMGGGSCCS